MSNSMNIILIRHGEFQNIGEGADPPLTKKGKAQAKKLAIVLQQMHVAKAYVSDRIRSVETFEEYKKLNPNIKFVKTNKLREIYGVIVGGPPKEGTSPRRKIEDKKRIDLLWKEILKSKDKTIAVFAHGNVIRYLVSKVTRKDPKKAWTGIPVDFCSITLIQKNKDSICVKCINKINQL